MVLAAPGGARVVMPCAPLLTYVGGLLKPADLAWLFMLIAIVAYELLAPEGELLSEGWDRYLEGHPFVARLVPLVITLHVINALPYWLDPVSRGLELLRAVGGFDDHTNAVV